MRTEGPGDRVGDGELTERTHDEINRNAADDIRQEYRWAGKFDRSRRAKKQTDTDRTAKAEPMVRNVLRPRNLFYKPNN